MADLIQNAMVKFEYKEPAIDDMAKHIGFNDDELNMLKIFWEPAFNKSWIVLNRDMIKTWFCKNDTSKHAVTNFYNRVLFKYDKNIDYKEVTTSQICGDCDAFWYSQMTTKIKDNRGGHNANYYQVTGECFKMISMERNKDIRRYYLKVEELAMFMKDYINAMHKYISDKAISDMSAKVESMRIVSERMQSFIDNTKVLEKKSTFYIATSTRYAQQNIFKPGHVDSISKKILTQRLAQYNTGKTGDDLFYFCYVEHVHDAKELDHKLKKLFVNMKMNKRKEMVICHWDDFIDIVKYVSANHTEDYNYFNSFITSGKFQSAFKKQPVVPENIWNHTVTITEHKYGDEIKTEVIDVVNLTAEQKKQYLIQAIEIFCTNNEVDYDHTIDKNNADKKITVVWKDLQTILKDLCRVKNLYPSKWRDPLKNISSTSKSIQQIRWVKKL
jgi:hypothetical protein